MQIEGKGKVLKLAKGYPQQENYLPKTDCKKGVYGNHVAQLSLLNIYLESKPKPNILFPYNVYHQLHTQFATISECLQHPRPPPVLSP